MKMMIAAALALLVALPAAADEPAAEEKREETEGRCAAVFVNVGGAMPPQKLWEVASRVSASLGVRIDTNAVERTALAGLMDGTGAPLKRTGKDRAVYVFFRNSPGAPSVVASPRRWAVVNTAPLGADKPAPPLLGERMAKVALRGLAYASGGGATMEKNCLMSPACDTLEGLDAAPFAISPMAYIPMLEFLNPAD